MIDGAAYTNLVGSGCADSVINCNLDQAVISMDVLDVDGKKMDVSSTSMLIMIPLNGDSTVNKLKSIYRTPAHSIVNIGILIMMSFQLRV